LAKHCTGTLALSSVVHGDEQRGSRGGHVTITGIGATVRAWRTPLMSYAAHRAPRL
jgi:hypothetical protein